jgi:hypothetical protein
MLRLRFIKTFRIGFRKLLKPGAVLMQLRKLFLILIAAFPISLAADNTPVLTRTGKNFDASIPKIKAILGYDFGEAITRHSDMEKYIQALVSASSSRMKVQTIGKTFEGRSLYYVILSSADNMARLEDYRLANLQLAEPRTLSPSQAQTIIENHPVFVGLSYSVHGNEHSGVETGLAMMYYLLASTDEETTNILKNCIVIIDPMQNPDGRERFIQYFYTTTGTMPNPDLNAAEHNENWPSGRTNHYLFDMNRDWTVLSQVETRARVKAYQQFQPQVYVDVHEMGTNSTYFFPPPTRPHNPNLPKSLASWWTILGKAIAADFDKNGIDYFTQEQYDFWYPGYGDSWPTYNGALSGTLEQASTRGLVVKRVDGIVVHYHDAIWHHFVSSLATCKMAAANRKNKLQDYYDFRLTAVQEGKTGPVKEYIIRRSLDPAQADRSIGNLLMHGIEVKQATAEFRADVKGYYSDRTESQNFHSGDYLISMDQPLKRLIQVMFEESKLDPKFLEEEARRREQKEPSEIYDITAWSMPLALGIDAYRSGIQISVATTKVREIPKPAPTVPASNYAYLLNYKSNQDILTALELLKRGIKVRFSSKPFVLSGRSFNAGSFIIRVKENQKELPQILLEIAQNTGAEFNSTATGWTEEGPDLGSSDVSLLRIPRVAVLTNFPTDANSYGEIKYLFEQRFQLEYTPIQTFYLNSSELKDYNVIILPDSSTAFGGYNGVLGKKGIEKLKAWVNAGGTLIAIQGAGAYLADDGELTEVKRIKKFIKDSAEAAPEKKGDEKEEEKPSKEDPKTEPPDYVIGSIARTELNLKNYLTYGYGKDELPVFVNSSNVFTVPDNLKPAVKYAPIERFQMAGLFWDITKKRLEKKAYATQESKGEGYVILFAENPNFRAAWESLNKLFMNGVLFGPSL